MFLSNKKLPIALPCVSFHSSLALISKTILDIAKLQIKPDKKDDLNLVLMENALRAKYHFCVISTFSKCLNPCFNGKCPQSVLKLMGAAMLVLS